MPFAVERWQYVTYDGTNSADVVALFGYGPVAWEVVSEAEGVLTVRSIEAEPTTLAFREGDVAVIRGLTGPARHLTADKFADLFMPLP